MALIIDKSGGGLARENAPPPPAPSPAPGSKVATKSAEGPPDGKTAVDASVIRQAGNLLREAKLERGALIAKVLREVRIMQQLTHVSKLRRQVGTAFPPEVQAGVGIRGEVSGGGGEAGSAAPAPIEAATTTTTTATATTTTADTAPVAAAPPNTQQQTLSSPDRDAIVVDMQRKLSSVLDRIQSLSEEVVEKRGEKEKLLEDMEEKMQALASDAATTGQLAGDPSGPNVTGGRVEVWNPCRMRPMSSMFRQAKVMEEARARSLHLDDDSLRLRAYHIFQHKIDKREREMERLRVVAEQARADRTEELENSREDEASYSDGDSKTGDARNVSRVRRRSQILDQVLELNTSAPLVDFEHGSKTEIHESHFCTYEKAEVIEAGGKYSCAECGSTSRALKLDADEHGVDLYCEPCWILYYDETFDGVPSGSRHSHPHPRSQHHHKHPPKQIGVR
jgi:hypothetical protein